MRPGPLTPAESGHTRRRSSCRRDRARPVDHGKGLRTIRSGNDESASAASHVSSVPSFLWHRAWRDGFLLPDVLQVVCQVGRAAQSRRQGRLGHRAALRRTHGL
ncbi:Hypothetical protein APM_0639 [Acidiphilium sp. PM]|nr:Hypothetical protein APM_0639 [Acidiphilium sp. PM]